MLEISTKIPNMPISIVNISQMFTDKYWKFGNMSTNFLEVSRKFLTCFFPSFVPQSEHLPGVSGNIFGTCSGDIRESSPRTCPVTFREHFLDSPWTNSESCPVGWENYNTYSGNNGPVYYLQNLTKSGGKQNLNNSRRLSEQTRTIPYITL